MERERDGETGKEREIQIGWGGRDGLRGGEKFKARNGGRCHV